VFSRFAKDKGNKVCNVVDKLFPGKGDTSASPRVDSLEEVMMTSLADDGILKPECVERTMICPGCQQILL